MTYTSRLGRLLHIDKDTRPDKRDIWVPKVSYTGKTGEVPRDAEDSRKMIGKPAHIVAKQLSPRRRSHTTQRRSVLIRRMFQVDQTMECSYQQSRTWGL